MTEEFHGDRVNGISIAGCRTKSQATLVDADRFLMRPWDPCFFARRALEKLGVGTAGTEEIRAPTRSGTRIIFFHGYTGARKDARVNENLIPAIRVTSVSGPRLANRSFFENPSLSKNFSVR